MQSKVCVMPFSSKFMAVRVSQDWGSRSRKMGFSKALDKNTAKSILGSNAYTVMLMIVRPTARTFLNFTILILFSSEGGFQERL